MRASNRIRSSWLLPALLLATSGTWAADRVVDTVHNLSTSGPGDYASQTVDRVCVFCHTPHRAARGPGLWNRQVPGGGAQAPATPGVTLAETLGGPSALCMSCHDGTIALGSMLNPPRRGGGPDMRDVFLRGRSAFGNDLSNHHPVGMAYKTTARQDSQDLADAGLLALPLRAGELHCTTCHEPHSDEHPPFLRKTGQEGQLCLECHRFSGSDWNWSNSAHATSDAEPQAGDPWMERKEEWKGRTVQDNACQNCHAPHNAGSTLALGVDMEERTCFRCHNGSLGPFNIQSEVQNFYRHPVEEPSGQRHGVADLNTVAGARLHVECEDCHNPHAARDDLPMISFNPANPADTNHSQAPYLTGSMKGVPGLDINGNPKAEADYEYEVCFKCHGVPGRSACGNQRCSTARDYQMARQDNEYNLREKFDLSNPSLVSYHPLHNNDPSNNDEVPSLRIDIPLYRTGSLMYCNDCHSGDRSPSAGLDAGRRFNAGTSPLCFNCHDAGSLISDESFPHRLHVWEQGASCVNCHDPHGSNVYPHLINFLETTTSAGRILRITGAGSSPDTPLWTDTGRYSGSCSLNCHGVVHEESSYGIMDEGAGLESLR
jgi:predicted CXXCH cytochrome family protein